MAFIKRTNEELPEDAVIISQDQALTYQLKLISDWDKISEVWALRYGPGILGVLGGISGIYINSHFRKKLKLGNYGKFSTYLPIVVLPSLFSTINHKLIIQRSVLLQTENCPVCLTTRAAGIQAGLGTIYPVVLAPFAALMFATRHFTYRLPSISTDPKGVFNLIAKFTKPLGFFITGSLVLNMVAATVITFNEMKQFFILQEKLQKLADTHDNEFIQEFN